MEFISGISIRDILLHNNNWWRFFLAYYPLIRYAIIINVIKIIVCGTKHLGYHTWICSCCGFFKIVFHTCKSRFCPSCGKKATDQWGQKNIAVLPNVPWQHITFTLPSECWDFFWLNRHLLNLIAPIPNAIMTQLARQKKIIPGVFMAIHTFGRDLKRNVHFHLSITLCGLSLDKTRWLSQRVYFHHQPIKAMWRHRVLTVLQEQFEAGILKLPKKLRAIQTPQQVAAWLAPLYQKKWVVHLSKPCNNHHRNIQYLGRYLKRPPISEARILNYNGSEVTYCYQDHQKKKRCTLTIPVFDFIQRLVSHIPDQNFRMIRYYNWLSNRTRSKELPRIYQLLNHDRSKLNTNTLSWRALVIQTLGVDPLLCPVCHVELVLYELSFPLTAFNLLRQHRSLVTAPCC